MNTKNAFSHFLRDAAVTVISVVLWAGIVHRSNAAGQENDYAQKLSQAHLFLQPIIWVGTNAPDSDETRDLYIAAGLDPDNKPADRIGSIEAYIKGYPDSPWVPSLRANLARYYRSQGRYSAALDNWQKAWDATKDLNDPKGRKVADYAVAYWSDLLSSLGRIEELKELVNAMNGRQLSTPAFQRQFDVARRSLGIMEMQPGNSFRCGSVALFQVARALGATADLSSLMDEDSPSTGFSLAQLSELSDQYHVGLVAVKRPSGSELVVPSVIHWKEDHYAAIVEKRGDGFEVIDPTFGRPQWLPAGAINENASGYFLVATNQVPSGWQAVSPEKMKTIFGKGIENGGSSPSEPRCDADGNPCESGTCPFSCPPGGAGEGGNGNGSSGGAGGGANGGGGGGTETDGNGNPVPCRTCGVGMPDWEVQEPFISVWLHDRPMFYNMSFGRQFLFQVDYHQREEEGGRYDYSFGDFGPNWNCNLLTYIRVDGIATNGIDIVTNCDDTGTNCVGEPEPFTSGEIVATEYCPDGGQRVYQWGGTNDMLLDPHTHVRFVPAVTNIAFTNFFVNETVMGNSEHYLSNTVAYPNGSVAVFDHVITISEYPDEKLALITSATDPQGHKMYYSYSTLGGGDVVLSQIVDFDGKTNQFLYGNASFPTSVTEVTNLNYRLGVNFKYDGNGRLTNIVDMAGISSSFQYTLTNDLYYTNYDGSGQPIPLQTNAVWLLTRLKTPYGDTTFDYFHPSWPLFGYSPDNNINRAITVTQPDSGKHLFLYEDNSAYNPVNYPQQTGFGFDDDLLNNYIFWNETSEENEINHDNSFYWGPRQYAALSSTVLTNLDSNDFAAARIRNWLHGDPDTTIAVGQTLNAEQDFSPNKNGLGVPNPGKAVWYGYEGKSFGMTGWGDSSPFESTNDGLPVSLGFYLDAGHAEASYENTIRNSNGYPTEVVDYGTAFDGSGDVFALKTNSYVYAANGIDMTEHIGADGTVQESYGYDGNHQVTSMANALNEVTYYTYNAMGQVTSITQPNNLVTTNIYGADGFLETTYDYCGSTYYRTNSYTYTNGLVLTHTDERGLTVTNSWDPLQRLKNVSYPDGTSISYTYNILDLVQVVDRMGFTNSYGYDNMRRKTAETNALGRATIYTYCTCGALDSREDALDNVTHFYYDDAGRLINTVYADDSSVLRAYNTANMLINTTNSSGKAMQYYYDGLRRLAKEQVWMNSGSWADVAGFGHDVNDLMTSQTNADGVVVNMTYDALHRLRTRTYPDTGVEAFGYTPNVSEVTSYTNQLTKVRTYAYDLFQRKTNEIALGVYTNTFAYDSAGDLLTLTDGKNQNTSWHYDLFGRATNKLDNLGTSLFVYSYDADDLLTNRVSAAKGSTVYSYDNVGNLTLVNYPVSPDITLQYDAMNRLTNMVDAVGTTKYSYDAVGQLLSEDGPWSDDTVSYTYANRLRTGLSVAAPNASAWAQSYGYDEMERMTNVTSPAGSFGYYFGYESGTYYTGPKPGTLLQQLSLPNGASITNDFDSVGRMIATHLINSSGAALDTEDYVYNLGGQRTQQVFTAGNYVNYTYDGIGELKTAFGREPSGTTNRMQEQFGYVYDATGNLNYRTNNTLLQQFNVNSLNELTTVTNGGRLTVAGTTTSPATNVTVNGSNAILYVDTTFASTNQPWVNGDNTYTAIAKDSYGRTDTTTANSHLLTTNSFAYDLNGNLLTNGTRVLEYDDENELIRITQPSVWKSEFSYDGKMRRRIRKEYAWSGSSWLQTNEVHYVYDGNLVIQERDGNNVPQVTYTRGRDLSGKPEGAGGIGGLLARSSNPQLLTADSSATAFYHSDGNGNVTALIYTNQSTAAKYDYDPYGNILGESGSLAEANLYRFSSKEYHPASGLIYYLCRYYSPNSQRWLNRDPIEERGSANLYEFARNRSTDLTDKFGLWATLLAPVPVEVLAPVLPPILITICVGGVCDCAIEAGGCLLYPDPGPAPLPVPPRQPKPPIKCPAPSNNNDDCQKIGETPNLCIYQCTSPGGPFIGVTRKPHPNSPCPDTASSSDVILPDPDNPNFPTFPIP